MRLKFVILNENERHIGFRVFQDGGNCGTLIMERSAALEFFSILKCAIKSGQTDLLLEIEK